MSRRYIGIENGDHIYTRCKILLDRVVSGEDPAGVSKSVDWKGQFLQDNLSFFADRNRKRAEHETPERVRTPPHALPVLDRRREDEPFFAVFSALVRKMLTTAALKCQDSYRNAFRRLPLAPGIYFTFLCGSFNALRLHVAARRRIKISRSSQTAREE